MEKLKILIIVGARPNFIKVAPLMEEFKKQEKIAPVLVHTGQHYDFEMSESFFQDLSIPKPDYNLGVGSGSHAWQTAKIIEKLEPIFLEEKPSLIIVIGDVNSTLAGALVARKMNIKIAHIESGLRSYDKTMAEEVNRVLTDHISDFLFCPTKNSVKNLKNEGIVKGIYNVGDIMYDALLKNIKVAEKQRDQILKKFHLESKNYFLLTIHRALNTDNLKNLKNIITALAESKEKIVFPVHPRTKKQIKKLKLKHPENINFIEPVGYLDMLVLEKNAKKVITDSGGVQKEAFWLKTPCITLRNSTEWIETLRGGCNELVGSDKKKILRSVKKNNKKLYYENSFGNGRSASRITRQLIKIYGK